ncbi:MAG: RNA polymerase subunit sigma-70 [Cytophagales bacterium CG12_big_fil_rev_8_21_14_0_65_40_12]|nr:MAG: RNA polymerase subunit sigma-70 [Cytophagales bacterium CG12_big_fil_rev_8_21_14_0_65_40_12]
MSHDQLIAEIKEGSQSAFRALVQEFQNRVYNTCLSILQNQVEAEETAQDVFIEVYRSISDFRGDSKLSTWIYRIATTKSLELIRKNKRQKRFAFLQSLTGSKDQKGVDLAGFDHPGVLMEQQENAAVLFKAIAQLPEAQKVAFTLHKVEGLAYQDICEIMETSLSSVESLMFRAKKNLQISLKYYYEKNFKD